MHIADLHTGIAKLIQATETLQETWAETKVYWHDDNSRHFEENHLEPIVPQVKLAVDAISRLADVLAQAQRECEE